MKSIHVLTFVSTFFLVSGCNKMKIETIEYLPTLGEIVTIVSPSQDSCPIRHFIEIFPKEIYFGDTIYLAAYDENVSTEVIENFVDYGNIPMHAYLPGEFTLSTSAVHKSYNWIPERTGVSACYALVEKVLQPGEKRLYRRTCLEFPPLDDWEEPFWKELRDNMPPEGITCHLHIKYKHSDRLRGLTIEVNQEILIKPRPENEMALLEKWYKNTPKKLFPKVDGIPHDMDFLSSGQSDIQIDGNTYDPRMFISLGNRKPSDPNNPTTLEGWRQLEASLVPSTMRDEVRLTRLQLEYYSAKKRKASENAKNELVQWLKSLPEVQRSIMITHLGSKSGHFMQSSDDFTKPTPLGEKYQELMAAIQQHLSRK